MNSSIGRSSVRLSWVRATRSRRISLAVLVSAIGLTAVAGSSASATSVPIAAAPSASAAAAATGSISGIITGNGNPLDGVGVVVYSDSTFKRVVTNKDGVYRFDGLPVGEYMVCAEGSAEFKSGCFGQVGTYSNPTPVVVTDGGTATADLELIRGAALAVTVLDPTGKPVKGASVEVKVTDPDDNDNSYYETTDDKGVVKVGPMEPGTTAWVHVTGLNNTGFAPEWYLNSATANGAKPITVKDIGINSVTTRVGYGSQVRGKVTDIAGKPVAGATVTMVSISSSGVIQTATTGDDGFYTVTGLVRDSYTVLFKAKDGTNLASEYHKDKSSLEAATPYAVGRGTNQRLDAQLGVGSSLSGKVTAGGVAVAGADVFVSPVDDATNVFTAKTDAAGNYHVVGLNKGMYTVRAEPIAGSGYSTTYFGNTPFDYAATPVDVGLKADVVNKNIALGKAGSISGLVTDKATGLPVQGAIVGVQKYPYVNCEEPETDAKCVTTGPDGRYRVDGVAPGEQFVYVTPPPTRTDLLPESYNNVHGWDDPTPITVKFSTNATADVQLDTGGILEGVVYDETGKVPVEGVTVLAYGQAGYLPPVKTGPDGKYQLLGAGSGELNVIVRPPQKWANTDATTTTVLGATKQLDFTLNLAAKISGKVVDTAGVGIADVCVSLHVYQQVPPESGWCLGFTKADGTYEIAGQKPGDYVMCFSQSAYANECFEDAPDISTAKKITLALGTDATADATLGKGGSASIRVLAGTDPVTEGPVAITLSTATAPGFGINIDLREMRPDGTMVSPHLAPGTYTAWYLDPNDYQTPWGKATFTVVEGQRAPAVIQILNRPDAPAAPAAKAASGAVTLSWDEPFDGRSAITSYVVQYRVAGGQWKTVMVTAPATSVKVPGLTNGKTYEFQVAAVNTIGQGLFSPITKAKPVAVVPSTTVKPKPTTTTTAKPKPTTPTTTTTKPKPTTTTTKPKPTVTTAKPKPTTPGTVSQTVPATGGGGGPVVPLAVMLLLVGLGLIVTVRLSKGAAQ